MTILNARPVDDPDQLALIADEWTPLRKPFADKFRDACQAEALDRDGYVDPNRVRRRLMGEPDYNPRQLAALWSSSCGPKGYMVKTLREVPIQADGSRGNGNKNTVLRRWVG